MKKNNNIAFLWELLRLNIAPFTLFTLFFILIPLILRQYYITPLYLANILKALFLFLFEALAIPMSIGVLLIKEDGRLYYLKLMGLCKKRLLDILLFSLFKSSIFLISFYFFRQKWSELMTFLAMFFYFSQMLMTLYVPPILAHWTLEHTKPKRCLFFASFLASNHIFFSRPFYTSFMFLCTFLLIILSIFTLNIFPSLPIIFCLLKRRYV